MACHAEEYSDSDVEFLASMCLSNTRKRKAEALQQSDNQREGETTAEAQAEQITESQSLSDNNEASTDAAQTAPLTESQTLLANKHHQTGTGESQTEPMTDSQCTEWMLKLIDEMDAPKAPAAPATCAEFKLVSYVSGINPPGWMTEGRESPEPIASSSSKSEQPEDVLTETQQLMLLLDDEDVAPPRHHDSTGPVNGAAKRGVIWCHMLTRLVTATKSEQQLKDMLHDRITT